MSFARESHRIKSGNRRILKSPSSLAARYIMGQSDFFLLIISHRINWKLENADNLVNEATYLAKDVTQKLLSPPRLHTKCIQQNTADSPRNNNARNIRLPAFGCWIVLASRLSSIHLENTQRSGPRPQHRYHPPHPHLQVRRQFKTLMNSTLPFEVSQVQYYMNDSLFKNSRCVVSIFYFSMLCV